MPDCGSGSFWFESRYLPVNMKLSLSTPWLLDVKFLSERFKFSMNILFFLIKLNVRICMFLNNTNSFNFSLNFFFKNFFNTTYLSTKRLIHVDNIQFKSKKLHTTTKLVNIIAQYYTIPSTKQLNVHKSHLLYYYSVSKNLNLINLGKFFSLWRNIINFLMNIFYFNLSYLIFSNPYFKYETLALNLKKSSHLINMWRLSFPFIFFIRSRATLQTESFFRFILLNKVRLSFVIDLYYHKTNLYYLNRFKFVTVGPVPLTTNLYLLSVSLPVLSNSILSNLFFFRFILKLSRLNSSQYFNSNIKSFWSIF